MKRVTVKEMIKGKRYSSWENNEMGSMEFEGIDRDGDPIFKNPTGDHCAYRTDDRGRIHMCNGYFWEVEQ